MARDLLGNTITDPCRPIREVVEVEAAHHRTVFINEHVEGAGSGLLLGHQFSMPFRKLIEEGIASVADRLCEVRAIVLLKGEDRRLMFRANELQPEHSPSLFRSGIQGTVPPNAGRGSCRTA